ncbi:hypothetical protein [Pararhizobium sp. O133]|uniref:hypothetical protein n=1 Tax=Pararhizobium sp. O133 TaxID=3449278 RepID=UPI003F689038
MTDTVKTNSLALSQLLDSFVANRGGNAVRVEKDPLAAQLIGSGPLAVALSALIAATGAIVAKETRAQLFAVADDFDLGDVGMVLLDDNEDYRGVYRLLGGTWNKKADLPADAAKAYASAAADAAAAAVEAAEIAEDARTSSSASATAAAKSAVSAQASSTSAAKSSKQARAAAEASGDVRFFDSYALAAASVGSLPANQVVEVIVDETLGGARVRYRKEAGVLVYKYVVQGEGATVPISYFGTVDFSEGVDALLVSDRRQMSVPAGTVEAYAKELDDGDHLVIDLNVYSRLLLAGAAPVLNFYSQPKWVSDVTSITRSNAVNLAETGNTANNNSTDVLAIGTPQTVKRGDLVKIVSDDDIDGGKHNSGSLRVRKGEIAVVGLDSSGSSISLTAKLKDTYTTNVRVFALKDARVDIINGRGDFDDALTQLNAAPIIKLEGLTHCHLSGLTTPRSLAVGVQLVGCYGARISGLEGANHHNDPGNNNFGYGVDIVGCEQTLVSNISGSNLRHLVTTDSYVIAANQTGRNLHRYGKTRGLAVNGFAIIGGSNAGVDTHDEADGVVFSGGTVSNGYAGANSGGAGVQLRGRNVRAEGVIIDGCQTGVALRTIEGGFFQGVVRGARKYPLSFGPGDSSTAQNCEAVVSNSLLEVVDCLTPNVISISCASGKTAKLTIDNTIIKISGDGSQIGQIFEISDAGVELTLIDVTLDLTGATGLNTIYPFGIANDAIKIRGNIKILGGAAVLANLLKVIGASVRTSDIELDVTVIGTNSFNQGSSAFPFGALPTVFTNTKIKGEIRYGSSVRRSRYTTQSPAAGGAIVIGGHLDDNLIIALTPTGDCIGFSGGLTIDKTNVRPGQRITLFNSTDFVVQVTGHAYMTLGPRASVTYLVTDAATPLLFLVSKSGQQGVITQVANYICGSRDNGAQMALISAANTETVTLPAGTTVDIEIDFYQAGTGYFTFAPASGATIRSDGGKLKTGGQYTRCRAKCIGNVGGSAAEWLLTGSLAV